ncbi:hypothetical protein J2Z79_003322 [Symbiobacterium terraclitae]|uniref:Cytochrome c-552/DMSO reductase-like haem-binding domain-containing protein n=1 Tax=Symbiobacterium terraclitae TaxID=557451 RepID=A0ABS4JWH5_9FIRM|nr:ethylbenzene dehydrogenase-related protein [Symbiobacterium terraclitae]MBP2019880.1 hypothetical protein [Symbiobacterium terraclitae]
MKVFRRLSRTQMVVGGMFLGLVLLSVALAAVETGTRRPAANPTVVVRRAQALPHDPWAEEWQRVSGVVLPLTVVSTVNPVEGNVQVKALRDDRSIAIRLEWSDNTQELNTLRPQDFADAAAVELATQPTGACMGMLDAPVHIWHWRADRGPGAREMATAYPNMHVDGWHDDTGQVQEVFGDDLYARPALVVGNRRALPDKGGLAENMIAEGFGTLTTAAEQPTSVEAVWKDGRWAAVFTRSLDGDPQFEAGSQLQAAFAVWDGKQMQRDGMKYITDWAVLELKP